MSRKAFTLIELLVVISIVAVIASVVLASLNSARYKAAIAAGKQFETNAFHAAADQAIGVWDMNECSGTPADRSGWSNPTSVSGALTWLTDNPYSTGCSLSFVGTNYVRVTSGASSQLNITSGPVTLSAWIKSTMPKPGSSALAVGNWTVGGANNIGIFWWDINCGCSEQGLTFLAGNNPARLVGNRYSDGKWHQITGVSEGTGTTRLYVDGALAATGSGSATISNSTLDWAIGGSYNSWPGFTGQISTVRIYTKALTASEVERLYAEEEGKLFALHEK
jgi:prepilin-type N-terminal cleavage/methylation domain-containing protein